MYVKTDDMLYVLRRYSRRDLEAAFMDMAGQMSLAFQMIDNLCAANNYLDDDKAFRIVAGELFKDVLRDIAEHCPSKTTIEILQKIKTKVTSI